eukprot:scaffold76056_cov70-Phaeocystis_antarctica.AAC.3
MLLGAKLEVAADSSAYAITSTARRGRSADPASSSLVPSARRSSPACCEAMPCTMAAVVSATSPLLAARVRAAVTAPVGPSPTRAGYPVSLV